MRSVAIRDIVIGEGMPKICVSLVGRNKEALLEEVDMARQAGVDMVEWRMDCFAQCPILEACESIACALREHLGTIVLLATFRSKAEGGGKEFSNEDYQGLYQHLLTSPAIDMIDLEIAREPHVIGALIAQAKQRSIKVILSYHDIHKTMTRQEMITCLQSMQALDGDISKIAVMPACVDDVTRLMDTTMELHKQYCDRPLVTMAMDDIGVMSRVCGEITGSAITFGYVKEKSAPGQLDVHTLKSYILEMHQGE